MLYGDIYVKLLLHGMYQVYFYKTRVVVYHISTLVYLIVDMFS